MSDSNEHASGWYAETAVAGERRPRLSVDLDVDVCVVGGGFAGLTAAREIARRGWSVALLEGGRIGWAASGRNTGFVLPGFGEDLERIVERIGLDHAKRLWALSERGLEYVRATIAETKMPGVDPRPGWLFASKVDNRDALKKLASDLQSFGTQAEFWPTRRLRGELRSKSYFGAVHYPAAFHIHPLNYAFGLAAAAESAGVRIFEETPAVAIDPAGVRKRIATPSARVRAPHVVLAGNVHLGSLMPRLAATLMPVTTYVMVTQPLGEKLHEAISFRGGVSDTEWADNHYRIVGGDRLMWSGRVTAWEGNPQSFARGLAADIARTFPQLGTPEIAHVWSGTLGIPVHRMPQVGELYRGVWVASGFAGHGLNTTAMAGDLIARGIVDGDQMWRLFAPYELVWAGGALGRAALQTYYWTSRPFEKMAQGLARYRERAKRARNKKNKEAQDAARTPTAPALPPVPASKEPAKAPAKSTETKPAPSKAAKGGAKQKKKKPKAARRPAE